MINLLILLLFSKFYCVTGVDPYSDTVLLDARAAISDKYQKAIENRIYTDKILDAFLDSSDQLQPEIIAQEGQAVKLMYLKNKVMTVKTARSCSTSGEQSGSGIESLTAYTRMVEFKVAKSAAALNTYGYARIFANELWNAEKSLFATGTNSIGALLSTWLSSNVSSVNLGDGSDGTLNTSIMEIAKADISRFYDIVRGHCGLNNYSEHPFIDVCNTFWPSTHRSSLYSQAVTTVDVAEANGIKLFKSNRLTPGTGYNSKHFLIPEGGIGIKFLDPEVFKTPENRGSYSRFQMSSMLYPSIMLGVKQVKECADSSGYGGVVDDDVDTWQVSVLFVPFDIPLSNSGETTIFDYRTLLS